MKYKVLKEFVLNGVLQKQDAIIELDYQKANLKSIQENIEKLADQTVTATGSVLDTLKPGVTLTSEQKEKLAKENANITAQAQQLAAEHHAKDIAEGKGEPPVKAVAEALKDKLINEEFQNKQETPQPFTQTQ